MDRSQAEARIGETIDRYRIEGVLGAGGFGAVFRARHVVMDRVVALKLLHGSMGDRAEVRERFLREARTLGRLGHPNVVAVHDSGISPAGEAFVVMELLEGEDLAARAERLGRMPVDETLRIVDAILEGLAAAHANGIVHRDLKPANVFLTKADAVKLVDFGISKLEDDRMTRTGLVLGTPVYMAPECFVVGAAGVDARADLYAVGVMLYELLSGRLPYDAPSYEALVLKVATEAPPPFAMVAPHAPPQLAVVVDRAMARVPHDRFSDANAMRAAIASVRASVGASGWRPPSDAFAATAHLPSTPYANAFGATPMPQPSPFGTTPAPYAGALTTPAPYAMAQGTPPPAHASGPSGSVGASPYGAAAASSYPTPAPATAPSSLGVKLLGATFGAVGVAGLVAAAYLFSRSADPAPAPGLAQVPVAVDASVIAPAEPETTKPTEEARGAVGDEIERAMEALAAANDEGATPPKERVDPTGSMVAPPPTLQKPRGTGPSIRMHEPNVVGEAPIGAIQDRFERARSSLERCRRDRDETVYVQLMVHDGRIMLAGPNPNEESTDAEVARCVANVMRDGGPLPSGQGIVQLAFDLAAR